MPTVSAREYRNHKTAEGCRRWAESATCPKCKRRSSLKTVVNYSLGWIQTYCWRKDCQHIVKDCALSAEAIAKSIEQHAVTPR